MNKLPNNEFEGARRILRGYYERVVREMAEDIIKNAEDFEQPFGNADSIIDKHTCRLNHISSVYEHLRILAREKPQGTQPLEKNEFRCFGCGGVIKEDDSSCKLCGWAWR